jgi:hypothetical protein
MKFFVFCLCTTLCFGENLLDNLPEPYCNLKKILPFDTHGWYANASQMKNLIEEVQPKIIIEVGSWLGKSSRHIASLLPDKGILYCVDHWLGTDEYKKEYQKKYFPILYEQFLSNVIHAKLTQKIYPIRLESQKGAELLIEWGIQADIVYIDACHYENYVYNDLKSYFPLVKGHGLLCGDDWAKGKSKPVQKAVYRFAQENNLIIDVAENNRFWVLRERR